ncbi:hypothetical protein WJX84_002902 [Apatococcus fuscideae]|uniref:MAT1 centre domain-containing protein n=1 Tax=Apatococcus fuscideae TaxID=2026836 RepID=A0AAW1SZ01_9CHLO
MGDLHKEMKIRQRVQGIFNRPEADFPGLQDWNDYLELREDIIMNLAEGVDVAENENRIAEYQRENYQEILENQARQAEQLRMAAGRGRQSASNPAPASESAAELPLTYAAPSQMASRPVAMPVAAQPGPAQPTSPIGYLSFGLLSFPGKLALCRLSFAQPYGAL